MSDLKASPYYTLSEDITKNPTGMLIDNEQALKRPGIIPFMPPDTRIRGFSHLANGLRPRLRYDRKRGRLPKDLEVVRGCWLITDRLKEVFEEVDGTAFQFLECDVVADKHLHESRLWLCDVVRVIDAVDEEKSEITIDYIGLDNRKMYFCGSSKQFALRERVVSENKIFPPKFGEKYVLCHQSVREMSKAKKLQGLTYGRTIVVQPSV